MTQDVSLLKKWNAGVKKTHITNQVKYDHILLRCHCPPEHPLKCPEAIQTRLSAYYRNYRMRPLKSDALPLFWSLPHFSVITRCLFQPFLRPDDKNEDRGGWWAIKLGAISMMSTQKKSPFFGANGAWLVRISLCCLIRINKICWIVRGEETSASLVIEVWVSGQSWSRFSEKKLRKLHTGHTGLQRVSVYSISAAVSPSSSDSPQHLELFQVLRCCLR